MRLLGHALLAACLATWAGCQGEVAAPDGAIDEDSGGEPSPGDEGGPPGDDGGDSGDDGGPGADDGGQSGDDGGQAGDDGGQAADDGGPAGDDGGPLEGHYFPAGAIWTQDVYDATPAPDSDDIIRCLREAGGWGNEDIFQIDFSIEVLHDGGGAPLRDFVPTEDFYEPDCDQVPVPIPVGGALEGEAGYACEGDGDCHLIVVRDTSLYEMWRANITGGMFYGGCLAVWDLTRVYGPDGRGQQCTSADAAGFPIAPLLFSADEVAAGEIRHAIRFILPNDRVRARTYVPPATHGTNTSGGPACPPYGVHFRLRRDYPLEQLPNEGARVVARALQRYGMFHADGGRIALTAQSDRFTQAKWDGLLEPRDLQALDVEDFEVIPHGDPVPVTYDCVRAP